MNSLKCEVVKKISKNGKEYFCLEIYLTNTYKKVVFLEESELELIKLVKGLNK